MGICGLNVPYILYKSVERGKGFLLSHYMVRLVAQLTRSRPEMKWIMKALTKQTKVLTEFKQMDSIVGDILY